MRKYICVLRLNGVISELIKIKSNRVDCFMLFSRIHWTKWKCYFFIIEKRGTDTLGGSILQETRARLPINGEKV